MPPVAAVSNGKDKVMWVFDGEEWTQEDGGEQSSARPEAMRQQHWAELVPELQVIEIVQVPKPTHIPPFPLP